jgi:hypothetical protein
MLKDGIETHGGKTNPHIFLIAPHGYPDPDNDENTGTLVREMQKILDCPVIINEVFRKPLKIRDDPEEFEKPNLDQRILDLNKRDHAKQHPTYIKKIAESIKDPASTFVFWIHGIKDENLAEESKKVGNKKPLGCLIGHGQGKPERPSCNKASVDNLIQAFKSTGIKAAPTDRDSDNYRGHHLGNMNQWFKESGNGLKAVQSIQLEFGMKGIRDTDSIEKTAKKFADALISLNGTMNVFPVEDKPDEKLVADALKKIDGFCNGGYHGAMLQAGEFIVKEFFGGDSERARNPRNAVKIHSLNKFMDSLQLCNDRPPSKTWIYRSIKLVIDEKNFSNLRAYAKLGHSQKVYLTHLADHGKKREFIEDAEKNGYSFGALKKKIVDYNRNGRDAKNSSLFQAVKNPKLFFSPEIKKQLKFDRLANHSDEKLVELDNKINSKIIQIDQEAEKFLLKINELKSYQSDYKRLSNRVKSVMEWQSELEQRKQGKEVQKPIETSLLKKLRRAVDFMCFFRGYDYDTFSVDTLYRYVPLEELNEIQSKRLLIKGKCNLKALWNFEITQKGKFEILSGKQVQKKIKQGTFWLSAERYQQLKDPEYYDYKEDQPAKKQKLSKIKGQSGFK